MSKHIVLRYKQVITLFPTAPFNFDATMHKPDYFPTPDSAWETGVYWQTMLWRATPLGLKLENRGTIGKPRVRLSVWSPKKLDREFLSSLVAEIEYRYNLKQDLREFNRRFRDDPQLGPIIRKWRGMRTRSGSLYEYLIIAIVLQNCTVRRSVNMMRALFERYGTALTYDGKELYCFWQPKRLVRASEHELRALKVGYRAKAILRVTEATARGQVNEIELRQKSKEEQRAALLGLYGIGPASVGYMLFDVFHQWDELSHISPWEQKIYSKLFFNHNPEKPAPVKKLLRLFERRFAGYRLLAVHYIWEDLFWKRVQGKAAWLEPLIRL